MHIWLASFMPSGCCWVAPGLWSFAISHLDANLHHPGASWMQRDHGKSRPPPFRMSDRPALYSEPRCLWFASARGNEHAWRHSLAAETGLAIHLNLQGRAEVQLGGGQSVSLQGGELLALRLPDPSGAQARRLASSPAHECLTLHFPDAWLDGMLAGQATEFSPSLAALLNGRSEKAEVWRRALTAEDHEWARQMADMKHDGPARQLLENAKLMEFIVREAYGSGRPEVRETRSVRLGRERVARVKNFLLENLESPPDLQELARLAGCTASYLSRTFTRMEGTTLSLWLRQARIEKAAGLISSGLCNVSEAALRVGYRSLSHFSRAFHAEKGIPPSRYVEYLSGTGHFNQPA